MHQNAQECNKMRLLKNVPKNVKKHPFSPSNVRKRQARHWTHVSKWMNREVLRERRQPTSFITSPLALPDLHYDSTS